MPIYIYKAATKNGQVVRNRVEEVNRFILLRRLKNNNLLPISVTQINAKGNNLIYAVGRIGYVHGEIIEENFNKKDINTTN